MDTIETRNNWILKYYVYGHITIYDDDDATWWCKIYEELFLDLGDLNLMVHARKSIILPVIIIVVFYSLTRISGSNFNMTTYNNYFHRVHWLPSNEYILTVYYYSIHLTIFRELSLDDFAVDLNRQCLTYFYKGEGPAGAVKRCREGAYAYAVCTHKFK